EHNFGSSMPQWLSEILDIFFASADQAMRALSELKDGVEVLQQLAQYGIEHLETVRVPEDIAYNKKVKAGDTKSKNKIKGFAFLEFSTHSVAAVTFQYLKKPDVVLGRDVSAKVSFEQSAKPSNDEDVPHVNRVHMAGLAKG
ncbi:nucleotide-binding alpha-beta plait domain-containing protein, partial [Tanacetum coccineum]